MTYFKLHGGVNVFVAAYALFLTGFSFVAFRDFGDAVTSTPKIELFFALFSFAPGICFTAISVVYWGYWQCRRNEVPDPSASIGLSLSKLEKLVRGQWLAAILACVSVVFMIGGGNEGYVMAVLVYLGAFTWGAVNAVRCAPLRRRVKAEYEALTG